MAEPDDVDPFDELRRGLVGEDAGGEGPTIDARRLLLAAGVIVLLAAGIVGGSALRRAPVPAATLEPEPLEAADAPVVTTTTTVAARVWPAEPVEIVGNEVRTGGNRWSVGSPGDLVAVGDWNCDGLPTPAVVRPGNPHLFVFEAWATDAATATATAAAGRTVPEDAVAVEPAGCGRATIRRAGGDAVVVSTGPTR